jgi:peroxiredoxin (alkyl hydroperoxide reductase subunit C)
MAVLVGKEAPDFSARVAIGGEIKEGFTLSQFKGKKYVVLFFYPLDFTFVCPTELHAFQNNLEAFSSRNAQLVACSTDSVNSHLAWLRTPLQDGGIHGVTYPIIADVTKAISRAYDVLDETEGTAYRATFVIDKFGKVMAENVNHRPVGRSVGEIVRLLDAVQYSEEYGEVCPADWAKGKEAMKATQEGLRAYFRSK